MVAFSTFLKEYEIKGFQKSYKTQVGDIEKTYFVAKKSYERALKAFVKKNITHRTYQSLWDEAFEFTTESHKIYTEPDQIEVLKDLISLHQNCMEDDDFYDL
jgi:5'-deoxynucleotidase YfbR-like HD superfamily hydrolase